MEDQWKFVCSINASAPALIDVNYTNSDSKIDKLSETTISYSELSRIVEKFRQEIGSNHPTTVGICLPPFSIQESSVLIACLCEEAWIYVPIDPSLPMRNQIQLLHCGQIDKILTYASSPLVSYLDSSNSHLNVNLKKAFKLHHSMGEIVLYQLVFPLQKSINSPPHKKALYILFTSGSTGKPKGVIGSRQGTWKRLEWMWQTFPLDLSREMAFRSTRFSFVDSIWEIAGPLFKGIPLLHIRSRSPRTVKSIILQDLSLFFQVLSNYRVTRLTLIPSVLDIVLTAYTSLKKQKKNKSQKLWLEYVLVSGEVFSYALVLKATHVWKQVTFVNLYGSTEVCGDITWYPIKSPIQLAQQIQWQKYGVPIGRKGQCIGDSMYRLLVDQEEEEKGEIQVSGSAVTLGYVEEHTIKFVQRKKNVKWFSTGDVGRFIDDELFFCGRKDQRIKIYGQWVDFILIERLVQEALDLHTDHEWSPQQFHVLFVVQSPSNDQELIAFIKNSCSQALQLNESQIRTFLAKTMPLHGLPLIKIHLKVLEKKNSKQIEVPLLSNGKLDRQAFIQSITKEKINGNHFSSALEKVLRKVLDLKGLFFKDLDLASQTFEQLGGNSLLASLVVWELQQQLQPLYDPLRPEHLLQGKTIEEIASMIQNPSKHRSFFQNVQPRIKKQRTCTLTQEKTQEKELQVSVVASFSRCSSSSSWSKPRRKNSFTKLNSFKLSKRWQLDLSKCIDASALIVQVALKKKWKTLIYIGSHASRFVCVHFDTGKIVWEKQLDDRIEASASVSHPLGLVYIGTYSGRLYALHLLTGQLEWSFKTQDQIKSSSCVLAAKHLVICGSYDHTLYGLEASTGICQWRVNLQGSIFAKPLYIEQNNTLYAATTKGTVSALSLFGKKITPTFTWTVELPGPIFSSPAFAEKYQTLIIGCANAFIYSLSLLNGEIEWKIPTNKPIFSSPCIYESDFMVIGCHDGLLRKICLLDGHICWETFLDGAPIFASPYMTSVVWACTTTGSIYLCDIETGRIIESYKEQHGEIFSSPVVLGNCCIVGTRSNQLLALDLDL